MRQFPPFTSPVVRGAGRGRSIDSPTLNLDPRYVPSALRHGIYACRVQWRGGKAAAALHFGPRPVFRASVACEVHVIDRTVRRAPKSVTVTVMKRLRAIRNFPSIDALKAQIVLDVAEARAILKTA